MEKKRVIFLDIHTQSDFLNPQGKLYIPGAEKIVDTISEIRKFALQNGYSIIATMDWHALDDDEISFTPDFRTTFPPHCMAHQSGSERIGYLGEIPIDYLNTKKIHPAQLKNLIDKDQFHIVIRGTSVDIFKNPNIAILLNLIEPKVIIVFGVALDICVRYAIEGLIHRNKSNIILLVNAVRSLVKDSSPILRQFATKGVILSKLTDFEKALVNVAT